jgi:ankyrin repeat protein
MLNALLSAALWTGLLAQQATAPSSYPAIAFDVARAHEIKPHRRTIPLEGATGGFNQLHITLTVSPVGTVIDSRADGDDASLKFWPQIKSEVAQWSFTPFEVGGKPATVQVEEYVDLVPPERLPTKHVTPPVVGPDSQIIISLARSGCLGSRPSYNVTLTNDRVVFDGGGNVVAAGKHLDIIDPSKVRQLADEFFAGDFYSMDPQYFASVTDNPSYSLSISVDGHARSVRDYVGSWVGMPSIITDLEDRVDELARTDRWIEGKDGLVKALQTEGYNFKSFPAQSILKEAARRGETETVEELLHAGVPLTPLPAPKQKEEYFGLGVSVRSMGWLTAASGHLQALRVLMDAGASKHDQRDKDLALLGAAGSGDVEAVRALISYGANPHVDVRKLTVRKSGGGMTSSGLGSGSVLIEAAHSGNPEVLMEILRYDPQLEARDHEGRTAIFAAGDYKATDKDGDRVKCVRMLAEAGANVNARDEDGNTPLHETFLTDVEEELLKLGANVNARNNDGETPIFTTVDDDAIPLFIKHGADLTIRNKKGETVFEDAARDKGPTRQKVLRQALDDLKRQ